MTLRTQHNLNVGMHGEAFASAKYKRFAAFARSREDGKLADLMAKAANDCRIGDLAQEMQMAGLISDDLGNLREVIRDKLSHIQRYDQFAKEAEEDGDSHAAELFRGLAKDDEGYANELETALGQYRSGQA